MSANANAGKILVRSNKVTKLEISDKFSVIGQCKNAQSQTYYANISGTIEQVPYEQNSQVKKGDLIISIDKALAESTYSNAMTSFKLAESTYLRDKILHEKKHISNASLEKSEANLKKTKYEFEIASKIHSDMSVRAPFDGTIGVVKVKIGDNVKVGDYLFSIVATSNKHVFLEVPERFYRTIDKNTEVIIIDNKGNKVNGNLVSISNHISDHGTVDIKVIVNDTNDIIHGSYVNAEFIINKHLGLMIPELSVLKNDQGNFVYKVDQDNVIKQIYVKLGSRVDQSIELISSDIKEGDLIVTEGLTKIQDGVSVEILN